MEMSQMGHVGQPAAVIVAAAPTNAYKRPKQQHRFAKLNLWRFLLNNNISFDLVISLGNTMLNIRKV